MNRLVYYIVCVVVLMAACKPQVPSGVIQPDDMEDLLVDYHLAMSMAQTVGATEEERNYLELLYTEEVFRKNGVSKADFDSSLVYYFSNAERFEAVYGHVVDRLSKQALALGATEGEIGKYAALNSTGDTANIWVERATACLLPMPPYNRREFEIEVDTAFHQGDTFLLQFMSDFVYQSGTKDGMLVLSTTYEGDTTVTRTTRFQFSGLNHLRYESLSGRRITRMRGFFYLNAEREPSTTLKLLFLSNIQLIRFHQEKTEDTNEQDETPTDPQQADSLQPADDGDRPAALPSGDRDTVRPGNPPLSSNGRAAFHRMADRVRKAQSQ